MRIASIDTTIVDIPCTRPHRFAGTEMTVQTYLLVRVETADGPLHTEQVEPVFNVHPQVRRTALVGVGAAGTQRPVLCVELAAGVPAGEFARIEAELRELGARHPHTARFARFLRHPGFPVDIRHNAKIGREKLAQWAAARIAGAKA